MSVVKIVAICLFVFIAALIANGEIYLHTKRGWMMWLYHDIFGWHRPGDADATFDGCSWCCTCRHCHKPIMQDSQGNWFLH